MSASRLPISRSPSIRAREHTAALNPAARALSWLPNAAIILAYVAIGLAARWPMAPWSHSQVAGGGADPIQSIWFLGWVPHAIASGANPFFTRTMLVPAGANLTQNTETPLLGLLMAPVTATLGPVVSFNLLMFSALPLSATSGFVVLRKWRVWKPAAALGGLMYGISPYMVAQGLDHLNLVFVVLPPLIASAVVRSARGEAAVRDGTLLGVLMAAQFLISPEVLATVCMLAALGLVVAGIRHRETARQRIRPIGVSAIASLVSCGVIVGYPVWMMVSGPMHYSGFPQGAINPYHNDLFGFLFPGPLQRMSLGLGGVGADLAGLTGISEYVSYIGLPVLGLAFVLAVSSHRRYRTQLSVALLLAAGLLSLGVRLQIDGLLTHVPLPFTLLTRLPLIKSALPSRFSLEVDACLAAVVAFGLDDIARTDERLLARTKRPRVWTGPAGIAFVTALALVTTWLPLWPYQDGRAKAVALPPGIGSVIPPGHPTAITYPYASAAEPVPMLWQASDGYRFDLAGGYALRPGPKGSATAWPYRMEPPALQQFLATRALAWLYGQPPPLDSQLVRNTRLALRRSRIHVVIVDLAEHGSRQVVRLFTLALGPPVARTAGFVAWVVR